MYHRQNRFRTVAAAAAALMIWKGDAKRNGEINLKSASIDAEYETIVYRR